MPDSMDTIKNLLGDDAPDKIRELMSSLAPQDSGSIQSTNLPSAESLGYIMQMRDIISKLTDTHDDPRSNLLVSLKPYMRSSRQRSIDSTIRLLNMTKLSQLFRG